MRFTWATFKSLWPFWIWLFLLIAIPTLADAWNGDRHHRRWSSGHHDHGYHNHGGGHHRHGYRNHSRWSTPYHHRHRYQSWPPRVIYGQPTYPYNYAPHYYNQWDQGYWAPHAGFHFYFGG